MKHHLAFLVPMECNGYGDLKFKVEIQIYENDRIQGGIIFECGGVAIIGVGTLQFIDGTMAKYQYINILANNIQTSSTSDAKWFCLSAG